MAGDTRLRFHLQSQGAVWYHLEASQSHVLVDPQAEARARAPAFVRPIELWRATRWKRPPSVNVIRYGTDASDTDAGDTAAGDTDADADAGRDRPTELGSDGDLPPSSGDVVNLASVVDFISDVSAFRLGALGALIDAVAAALEGGPPVVLAAPTADQGAMWIGAVSFFSPPPACLRLSFSTHERWDDVLAQLARDGSGSDPVTSTDSPDGEAAGWRSPVLSVVPQPDVDRLTRRDKLPVLVLDPRVEPTFEVVDGVQYRRTHLGQQIKVTDWSTRALGACREDYAALERRIQLLDQLSRASPPSDEAPGQQWAAVEVSGRAEPAWDRLAAELAAEPIRAPVVQAAFEGYLRLAVDDDQWLLRQAPPLPSGVPAQVLVEPGLASRLRTPLARLAHRLTDDLPIDDPAGDVRRGLLLLRAVDFAHRIVRLVGGPDPIEAGIGRLAGRAVEVLLDDTAGPRVAEIVGPLDGAALARWIVPPLSQPTEAWLTSGNPVGERLPAPVVALLAGAVEPARLITSARADPLSVEPVALEVAVASASGRIAGDPGLRAPAVEYLLNKAARSYPDADPGPMVAEVFHRLAVDEPWSAEALLRLVERAPATLGAELVPIGLRQLPDWVDDVLSARLAAALLKRIQFLPRLGADGRPRPRRAGTTDGQAQLLNLLAASGVGWLQLDDGLHRRAAEILMWGDRAWAGVDPEVQRLIAPRITVAAFQVALAAEPDLAKTVLGSRRGVVPVGSGWRSAVTVGLEPALPMLAEVLRLNRFRLAGELVVASTRAMLDPASDSAPSPASSRAPDPALDPAVGPAVDPALGPAPDRPRVSMLPVGPVIQWLVEHEQRPELKDHLAALVEQELREHPGSADRPAVIEFWERALPDIPIRAGDPSDAQQSEPIIDEVLQVALGLRDGAGRPRLQAGLARLLALPARRSPTASTGADPAPAAAESAPTAAESTAAAAEQAARPSRPRWWQRSWWTSP